MQHGGFGERRGEISPVSSRWIALMALLVIITMLFAAFTSVYWERALRAGFTLPLPPALTLSTAALLLSSYSVTRARSAATAGDWPKARVALGATACLGILFALAQFVSWQQLASRGVFLRSHPHSAFFYLLTLVHVLHVVGGIAWMLVARARLRGLRPLLRVVTLEKQGEVAPEEGEQKNRLSAWELEAAAGAEGVSLCATYWHYLGGLWVYLLVLLFIV